MPAPDLIVGKLRYAHLPAELVPVPADFARAPTLAPGLRPDIDPLVAVALREATAGIAGNDDPAVLAADHFILHQSRANGPGLVKQTGAADDPQP